MHDGEDAFVRALTSLSNVLGSYVASKISNGDNVINKRTTALTMRGA